MKSTIQTNPPPQHEQDDIDLGLVIHKTGNIVAQFFNWIGKIFISIGNAILRLLFFMRRNALWLLLGLAVGFGYGLYLFSKNGVKYYSEMTVKTNFNSARALYGSVDYLNSMIANRQIQSLAKVLSVSESDAASLVYFEILPVKSELITARMYRDQFLNIEHNATIRMDTFWTKTIKYNDFKQSLTDVDYPLHEVTVTSALPDVFARLQSGFINQVAQNQLLQKIRSNDMQTNKEEIAILVSSIRGLDSLREAYNKRLMISPLGLNPGNNIYMQDRGEKSSSPELQLYDKVLELKEELRRTKSESAVEDSIVEVYAPFNSFGNKESFLRQSMVSYSIAGFLVAFVILSLVQFYRSLGKLENKMRHT